jgi:hypothetical protein
MAMTMSVSDAAPLAVETGFPNYYLSPKEMAAQEYDLVERFYQTFPDHDPEGVVVFSVRPESMFADFGRSLETITFDHYDSEAAQRPHEARSTFLYTTNLPEHRIAHVKRVVSAFDVATLAIALPYTGLETVDDRLKTTIFGEHVSIDKIADVHGIEDFSRTKNVTSNMAAVGMAPSMRNPYSLISYKAVFQDAMEHDVTHLFAYMNLEAVGSLGKLGVKFELLAGEEFHLPIPNRPGEYDEDFLAVVMPHCPENVDAFTKEDKAHPMRRLIASREVPIIELQ